MDSWLNEGEVDRFMSGVMDEWNKRGGELIMDICIDGGKMHDQSE